MNNTFARYEIGTDTIRHVPSNVCLVAFGNGECLNNYSIDGANKPVRETVKYLVESHPNIDKYQLASIISEVLSKTPEGRKLIWANTSLQKGK